MAFSVLSWVFPWETMQFGTLWKKYQLCTSGAIQIILTTNELGLIIMGRLPEKIRSPVVVQTFFDLPLPPVHFGHPYVKWSVTSEVGKCLSL